MPVNTERAWLPRLAGLVADLLLPPIELLLTDAQRAADLADFLPALDLPERVHDLFVAATLAWPPVISPHTFGRSAATRHPLPIRSSCNGRPPDTDSFEAMMARAERTKGFFVSFDFWRDAMTEIDAFFRKSGRVIIPLTVQEISNEQIARKLA
jgi:hypothetical protein